MQHALAHAHAYVHAHAPPNQVSSFTGGFLQLWVGCFVLAGAALLCHFFLRDSGNPIPNPNPNLNPNPNPSF